MSTKDGGPAFPVPGLQHDEAFNGMSLRDYFAAHATDEDVKAHTYRSGGDNRTREQAKYAYADEMLKAREEA